MSYRIDDTCLFFASIKYITYKYFYSHLSNSQGGCTKPGGGPQVPELINEKVGINVEGLIFWRKLVHTCNKRGVEGGKNLRNQ